jgi:copper homeostasis protein
MTNALYDLYLKHRTVQTDTRKLQPGQIFFALKGPNFNANAFAQQALDAGAAGVVYGVLSADGFVDMERCTQLIDAAGEMKKVFHRAFDMTADPFEALDEIMQCGFDILLTSGRRQTAAEGITVIKELCRRKNNSFSIMAGSGINIYNAGLLLHSGADALHFSCRSAVRSPMHYRNPELSSMGNNPVDEYERFEFDFNKLKAIREITKSN